MKKRHAPVLEFDVRPPGTTPDPLVLNYPGDVAAGVLAATWPMGPNYNGELLWPVTAVYDAEAGRTRVTLTNVPPPGWEAVLLDAINAEGTGLALTGPRR